MNINPHRPVAHRLLAALVLMACTWLCAACTDDAHHNEYGLGENQGALVVGLESELTPTALTLYVFSSDGVMATRRDYADPRDLASTHLTLHAGTYILVVVANVPADALPGEGTQVASTRTGTTLNLPQLVEELNVLQAIHPRLQTASTQTELTAEGRTHVHLTLTDGMDGIGMAEVTLRLTVPDDALPPFTSKQRTRATSEEDTHRLRCVAEVYRQGTTTPIHRRVQLCEAQADGTCLATLFLQPGNYDIRLWADWVTDGTTADKYYNADDLGEVTILTTDYVANGQTDEKDAYYATSSASINGGTQDIGVELIRPFARYRLVADDVEGYLNLIARGEDLPPIDDLEVRISYEAFFPTGFNVEHGWPTNSQTGVSYSSHPMAAEGFDFHVARQVGGDFILAGAESGEATITVTMLDSRTGEVVSRLTGIPIAYRRGYLTTVTGTFLTAGLTPGGVMVDTSWEDENIVEFQP